MSLEKLSVLAILLLPACHPVREIPFQSNARPDRPTHTTSSHTEPSVIRATPAP
ncbi:MAG: hypothetical protein H7Y36_05190, partial [Armatimonadetes bacterium]|nr:hypothetical protein [Akkermansiaceae bacterium]